MSFIICIASSSRHHTREEIALQIRNLIFIAFLEKFSLSADKGFAFLIVISNQDIVRNIHKLEVGTPNVCRTILGLCLIPSSSNIYIADQEATVTTAPDGEALCALFTGRNRKVFGRIGRCLKAKIFGVVAYVLEGIYTVRHLLGRPAISVCTLVFGAAPQRCTRTSIGINMTIPCHRADEIGLAVHDGLINGRRRVLLEVPLVASVIAIGGASVDVCSTCIGATIDVVIIVLVIVSTISTSGEHARIRCCCAQVLPRTIDVVGGKIRLNLVVSVHIEQAVCGFLG